MEKVKLPRAANTSFVKLPTLTSVPLIKKSKDLVSFVFNLAQLSFEISLPDDSRPKYHELGVPQSADISVAVNRNIDLIPCWLQLLVVSSNTLLQTAHNGSQPYTEWVQSVTLGTTSNTEYSQLHSGQSATSQIKEKIQMC